MPITEKITAEKYAQLVNESAGSLETVVRGKEPNENVWDLYSYSPEDFCRDFVEIDASELSSAIAMLEGLLKDLKKAKTLKVHKLAAPVKRSI